MINDYKIVEMTPLEWSKHSQHDCLLYRISHPVPLLKKNSSLRRMHRTFPCILNPPNTSLYPHIHFKQTTTALSSPPQHIRSLRHIFARNLQKTIHPPLLPSTLYNNGTGTILRSPSPLRPIQPSSTPNPITHAYGFRLRHRPPRSFSSSTTHTAPPPPPPPFLHRLRHQQ